MQHSEFEAVIGLEVHCQLSTETKIFCGCKARVTEGSDTGELAPNSNSCPICAGHPGTLPVLNRKVVEFAVKAGLATQCSINRKNTFSRKNYFYPDLPRGYQISQYDEPICENGWLEIETRSGRKKINIQRIHMEEDAGKNVHMSGYSLVNLNRAGTPLIEIVSHPDMRSSEEAGAYLRGLHGIVTALGICDGNMQNGNFRCDANVSVMLKGAAKLGTRAEIKNVNSFRFVEKAIEYEIARQIEVVKSGRKVVQETRLYDSSKDATFSMRSKEEAHDYRYFPDPDLIPVQIEEALIEKMRSELPELPEKKKARFIGEMGLSSYDAGVLTDSLTWALFFEETILDLKRGGMDPKTAAKPVANLIAGELARLTNDAGIELQNGKIRPTHLAEIVRLSHAQTISSSAAKKILGIVWETGDSVPAIVDREGLKQVNDLSSLDPIIDQVLQENPGPVAEFKAGKDKLISFFVGQVMRRSGGKANPTVLQELIKKRLSS